MWKRPGPSHPRRCDSTGGDDASLYGSVSPTNSGTCSFMASEPRKCIFCGANAGSREHLWSEWMHNYITKKDASHSNSRQRVSLIPKIDSSAKLQARQGTILNKRIRCVCDGCNNGWMNRFEQSIRPNLVNLITGQPTRLDTQEITNLAGWIALKSCVIDQDDRSNSCVSKEDAEHIYINKSAPRHWRIGIYTLDADDWRANFNASYSTYAHPSQGGSSAPKFKASTITIGFEKLLMRSIFAYSDGMRTLTQSFTEMSPMRTIWPLSGHDLNWPTEFSMNDDIAEIEARAFFRGLGSPL